MVTAVGWSAGGSPARTGLLNRHGIGPYRGPVARLRSQKVAQAEGRAGDGAAGEEGTMNTMLHQVVDGVWVRQSAWVWSNAIVVRGEGGLVLVDPGIDGSELTQLADEVDRLGIPVVAGFSTHPHWDHLLWHSRFGNVPRYATAAGARAAGEARERAQQMAADSAPGIPLELIGLLTPLPAEGGPVPGEIIGHQAHAIGHAAVLLADRGVLLAGDMLSDV